MPKWLGFFLLIGLAACGGEQPVASPTEAGVATTAGVTASPAISPSSTPVPTSTGLPATVPLTALPPAVRVWQPADVAYDLVAHACEAQWSTNAQRLPCPTSEGQGAVVIPQQFAPLQGRWRVEAPLLLLSPGVAYPQGLGLFGQYPPRQVAPGEVFRAIVACQAGWTCQTQINLEYVDELGALHTVDRASWTFETMQTPRILTVDLTPLVGSRVSLLLAVREQREAVDEPSRLVLIAPHIAGLEVDPPSGEEAVVTGQVDYTTAPPYFVDDPMALGPIPVIVVLFRQEDGQVYWTMSGRQGRFAVRVPPGHYTVVGYGPTLPDGTQATVAYVGATGGCGQPLQTITVAAGEMVPDVVLAGWDTCVTPGPRPPRPRTIPAY